MILYKRKITSRMFRYDESGNALFLILIAVALFAALSYVVTQSNRGGGDVTGEKAKLIAAQYLQKIQEIQTAAMRLRFQGYEQIFMDRSPADTNGTCYNGAETRTPCKTIGIFSAEAGIALPQVSKMSIPSDPEFRYWSYWSINSGPLRINGQTLVTDAADEWLKIWPVEPQVCGELNRRWRGDPAPAPDPSNYSHALGSMESGFDITPPVTDITQGIGTSGSVEDLPDTRFCSGEPEWGQTLYYVLQER